MDVRNTELQERIDFARHIAETTPDIIFIMNIDTKEIIYANRLFTDVLNYSADQVQQMSSTVYDIMYPDDIPRMIMHVEEMRTAADGELRTIEYRLIDADGGIRWFIDRNAVFRRDINNVPVEKIGISHEITSDHAQKMEILALNKALAVKNRSLEDLNSELTQFFTVAGRDLKDPLRKAYSFLEMILNKEAPNLTNAGRSYFRRVQGAIQRLNLITDDILMFSRVNAYSGNAHPVRLSEVFNQVLLALESTIKDSKATVLCDELPLIPGHKELLYLLFYHLVENALKFTLPTVPPEVIIRCAMVSGENVTEDTPAYDSYVEIDFCNNGVGLDPADSDRLFRLFEKGDHDLKKKGLGIGLALCKKIVDIHEGHIYAANQATGSIFTCLLPAM